MDELYETKISNVRWIAYDLPGNVGWITYLVCLIKHLCTKWDLFSAAAILPGALMLLGIGELISERIARLDRVLPRKRLLCGFGALTLGGISGTVISLLGFAAHGHDADMLWMAAGSALCAVFAGLIYGSFRKRGKV